MNPKSNIEMKKVLLKILFIFFPIILFAQNNYYDVVVVGGTPGGIMSAITTFFVSESNWRMVKTVIFFLSGSSIFSKTKAAT